MSFDENLGTVFFPVCVKAVLHIRRGDMDNLGIMSHISP